MTPERSDFDSFSGNYDLALANGLSVSGEDKNYFASRRIAWTAKLLEKLNERPGNVMDFGCGIGSAVPFMFDFLPVASIIGIDTSAKSLEVAQRNCNLDCAKFILLSQYEPSGAMDLVYCNGVFHHIAVEERAAKLEYIFRALRPGGLFAFWENNPWNPGTRYVMNRIPFDKDAMTLSAPESRRLLKNAGFEILRIDFLFIFPRALSWFRGAEPSICRLPLGAQYQVLCRKPRLSSSK